MPIKGYAMFGSICNEKLSNKVSAISFVFVCLKLVLSTKLVSEPKERESEGSLSKPENKQKPKQAYTHNNSFFIHLYL